MISKTVLPTSFWKLFCSLATSYTVYIEFLVLKEWKAEIEEYWSIHQYMFHKIGVVKILEKPG